LIGLYWFKSQADTTVEDVERLQASANAMGASAGGEPSGDCKRAHACCRIIAAKSTSSAAAVEACEVFKTAGYPEATCSTSLVGYRKTAEALGVKCE
jgi:hypothetical protein